MLYVLFVAPLIGSPSWYHWYDVAFLVVSVALPPEQNVPNVIVIIGLAGNAFAVTVTGALCSLTHPVIG